MDFDIWEGSLTSGLRTHIWFTSGPQNLWHAYSKVYVEGFPWHAAFYTVPIFLKFLLPDQSLYIVKNIYIYIYISDCVESVYELPLIPNKSASETFLHKLRAVRSVDWIFIIGLSAWRWLGEYVILNKKVLQSSLQTGIGSSKSYCNIFFFSLYLKQTSTKNVKIILWINYTYSYNIY